MESFQEPFWGRYKPFMGKALSSTAVVATLAVVAAASLGTAFVAQYGYGLQPCHLCLLQRLPWGAVLFLGVMGLLPAVPPEARRNIVWLCAALFAANAVLAAYHAGVEYKWWPGPTSCTGGRQEFTLESLAAALNKPSAISCEEAAIRVMGISMAGANAILCAVLAVVSAWAAAQKRVWSGS
jgi:disulfide bond formation protein DsbB